MKNSLEPPRIALGFLKWFCPPSLLEEIEGDLLQKFHHDLQSSDHSQWSDDYRLARARRKFIWNTIRFFRPGILMRNKFSVKLNQAYMIRSHLLLAGRNLLKNRTFSIINVLGLSVGMVACILIYQYVRFELSYDKFHANADNIYRVATKVTLKNEAILHVTNTYEGIAKALKEEFPEVKAATTIGGFDESNTFIRYEDEHKALKPLPSFLGFSTDKSFFNVFSFPFLEGNPQVALQDAYTAVVSESIASHYFKGKAIGKIIEINDGDYVRRYKVTSVVKNVPANSHFKFDLLIHSPEADRNFWNRKIGFWDWGGPTYVLLQPNAGSGKLEHKLNNLAVSKNELKTNKDDYGQRSTFNLQPLTSIHLGSNLLYELEMNGSSSLVYALIFLAIVIIVVAWVNYVNLATAISAQKVKSVGIRKIMGASRWTLIGQVLTESAVFNLCAIVIAIILAGFLLPVFATFTGIPLDISALYDGSVCFALVCFFMVSSLLAGFYPAVVISSFYPINALNRKGAGGNTLALRKGLVVIQFTIAVALMIIMAVSHQQLSFMRNKDLGININKVVVIKAQNFDQERWSDSAGGFVVDPNYLLKAEEFKNKVRADAEISHVTSLSHLPGEVSNWGTEFKAKSIDPEKAVRLKAIGVDYDFVATFRVKLLAGRNFSTDFPSDQGNERKRAVLINEAASKLLGFRTVEEAVHSHISTYWGADYEIIGVVNSFHQLSVKQNFEPLYFILQPRALSYYAIHFTSDNIQGTLKKLRSSWDHYFPDQAFNHFFLDTYFDRQYQYEQKFSSVMNLFSGLAIIIACLGLFGLTSYAIVQRTREIGIRKVLGATALNVIALFANDFLRLIFLASALAIPLVYVGASQWLENYAFRIALTWWIFGIPFGITVMIAILTVSLQSINIAVRNPVESLKHE
jgi:putative ABC transport system permease protein